jgi:hypothetical protein
MRYASIDILRTIALVVMVLVHFSDNLAGVILPIAGFGAPLFAFLSGVSYAIWSSRQLERGKSEEEVSKVSIRRGLFVFFVGVVFNVLVWLPEDVFNWDVLTFIGTALILLNFMRRLPLSISAFVAVVAILVSPLLQELAEYETYWQPGYFDPDLTLSDVLAGFLATGYFPLFPWVGFSIAGFITGTLFFKESSLKGELTDAESPRSPWEMVGVGGVFFIVAFTTAFIVPYLPLPLAKLLGEWGMRPSSVTYVFGTLGLGLMLSGLMLRYVDGTDFPRRHPQALSIAKTFSRYAFTIYVLHHVAHVTPLLLYGQITQGHPYYYWTTAMPFWAAFSYALVFLATCYFLLRWLGPERTYGIEAGMRWLCD